MRCLLHDESGLLSLKCPMDVRYFGTLAQVGHTDACGSMPLVGC